jgi:hypothetical protein
LQGGLKLGAHLGEGLRLSVGAKKQTESQQRKKG